MRCTGRYLITYKHIFSALFTLVTNGRLCGGSIDILGSAHISGDLNPGLVGVYPPHLLYKLGA
jgi:hypothetical protein